MIRAVGSYLFMLSMLRGPIFEREEKVSDIAGKKGKDILNSQLKTRLHPSYNTTETNTVDLNLNLIVIIMKRYLKFRLEEELLRALGTIVDFILLPVDSKDMLL